MVDELERYFEIAAKDIDTFTVVCSGSQLSARRQAKEKFLAVAAKLASLREQAVRLREALGAICSMEGQEGMTDAQFARDAIGIASGALASSATPPDTETAPGADALHVAREAVVRAARELSDADNEDMAGRGPEEIERLYCALADALAALRKAEGDAKP